MSEWISVKDRLPEDEFVFGTDGKKVYMWKNKIDEEWLKLIHYEMHNGVKTTHWMPLPKPPEENE